jgi:hypothetical protein
MSRTGLWATPAVLARGVARSTPAPARRGYAVAGGPVGSVSGDRGGRAIPGAGAAGACLVDPHQKGDVD